MYKENIRIYVPCVKHRMYVLSVKIQIIYSLGEENKNIYKEYVYDLCYFSIYYLYKEIPDTHSEECVSLYISVYI